MCTASPVKTWMVPDQLWPGGRGQHVMPDGGSSRPCREIQNADYLWSMWAPPRGYKVEDGTHRHEEADGRKAQKEG